MYNRSVSIPGISPQQLVCLKRTALGLSARGLSIAAGLSPSYVSKLESGRIEASLHAFSSIIKILKLSPLEVFIAVTCASEDS